MAKKRLNKKVALIGSAAFIFVVLAAIAIILYLSQDPQKFIKDGDMALEAARKATDEQLKKQEYDRAQHSYLRARSRAKSDELKVQILFKLVDLFLEIDKWPNVLGCWDAIIQIDKKNPQARFGRLKYFYIIADNGMSQAWNEVATQATDFIELSDERLLAEKPDKFESFEIQSRASGETMLTYLHLLRGRANLAIARRGSVTEPEKLLEKAIADLEKVIELEPTNVDAYWYRAQAFITKGQFFASKDDIEQRDICRQQAKEILEQAVKAADENADAHINLIKLKPMFEGVNTTEQLEALESEYLSIAKRFDTNAQVYSTLAAYYWLLGYEKLDKAIENIEKAIELDNEKIIYPINAANLYYKKFSIYADRPSLYKAIEMAKKALELPDAQDKPGPRYWANKMNRETLYTFLANCYIEQVLAAKKTGKADEPETDHWLKESEEAVHQIEQIYGSGEEPTVVKWQGMLELAKGQKQSAVKKLYSTYEKYKAAGRRDTQLAYTLGRLFADTVELGAAAECFAHALSISDRSFPDKIDETRPESLLDYADVLLRIKAYNETLEIINFFEQQYWPTKRSEELRFNAYIANNLIDKAEETLAESKKLGETDKIRLNIGLLHSKINDLLRSIRQEDIKEDDKSQTSVKLMKTELKGHTKTLAELTDKLLTTEPNSLQYTTFKTLYDSFVSEGKIDKAGRLVDKYLELFPENATVLAQKQILSEPEPDNVSAERVKEIEKQVLSGIEDPVRRALYLGAFYNRNNEPNQAIEEYKGILEPYLAASAKAGDEEITARVRLAAGYLFDLALGTREFALAESVEDFARRENLDQCEGKTFAARLAIARGRYEDALADLNECLKERPVFSFGYMLRSQVNGALGNEYASIEDARKAVAMNPMNGDIAKVWADVLYQRNVKLGDDTTAEQIAEVKDALINAIRLNPGEWKLQGIFADYISDENPEEALAIRQRLQETVPTVQNALMLGKMAMTMAAKETDPGRKETLYDIAASSFEKGRKINPESKSAIREYAGYYRATGQDKKAEQLLTETNSPGLLWRHYVQTGQFSKSKEVLEQLYQSDANNIDAIKGFLIIAERTNDKEAVKKYSQKLLALEDSIENHLTQIDSFLKMGLVSEADLKLQSFREKYPDQGDFLILEASLAMKKGQLEKALELANKNLQNRQNDPAAWRLRGEVNRLMANYDQSVIDFKKSKSLDDNPVTRLMLAKAYIRAERHNQAVNELKSIIDEPQVSRESRMLLEQTYRKLGRMGALRKLYEEVLEKFPDDIYWYNRAASFSMAIKDIDTAEKLYLASWTKGSKDSLANVEALEGYLNALLMANKLNRLFAVAGKHVDDDFAPIAYMKMAEAEAKLKNKEQAIAYCQKAIEKSGTDENFVSAILFKMYRILGPEEVLNVCKNRLNESPESLAANFGMFNLANINGEYNKAIDYIDKCLEIIGPNEPQSVDYIVQKAEVLQAAYTKTSDKSYLAEAVIAYESLLDKWPKNTSVLNNLAYMMVENNESLEKALEYARRACEIEPEHPGYLDTYGYALHKNGKYEKAVQRLQASLQQFEARRLAVPWDVYEHLGMANEKLAQRSQAYDAYKQASELLKQYKSGLDEAKQRVQEAIERLSQ